MIEIDTIEKSEEKPQSRAEFKVRPVTRYIVTKYTSGCRLGGQTGSENLGEFQNVQMANQVCHAMAVSHLNEGVEGTCEVYYKLYSHEYDETEFPNNGLVKLQ